MPPDGRLPSHRRIEVILIARPDAETSPSELAPMSLHLRRLSPIWSPRCAGTRTTA